MANAVQIMKLKRMAGRHGSMGRYPMTTKTDLVTQRQGSYYRFEFEYLRQSVNRFSPALRYGYLHLYAHHAQVTAPKSASIRLFAWTRTSVRWEIW